MAMTPSGPAPVATPVDVPIVLPPEGTHPDLDGAEVSRLIAEGRFVETIALVSEANRRSRSGDLERALIALRYHAAMSAEPGPGREPWPPVYADPFHDVVGVVPEVAAAELTTQILGGAVAHHGALLVRGVFGPDQIERSTASIEATYQSHIGDGEIDPAWFTPFPTDRHNGVLRNMVLVHGGGTWMADSPAGTAQVLDELEAIGVIGAIAGHLGERPYFSLQKSTLRRSEPKHKMVAWHQDGSFLDDDVRTMNVWVALSPCGGDRPSPGLEVIPRRIEEILPVDGVMSTHSISYDLIDELSTGMPTVFPEFDAGDALIFDEHFVHRTHLSREMTQVRYALECWFFAPSHQSSSYTPLYV